jgi:hypothetical protein
MFLVNVPTPQPVQKVDIPVVKDLKAAKALLEKRGWIQRQTQTKDGFCVIGVICLPTNNNYDEMITIFEMANNIKKGKIANWNDRWWRTKKSVLRAFDKAIRYAQIKL